MITSQYTFHYEKKGCFVINFPTQFLNCIGHLQFTIHMVPLITTQLQLCRNNSFSTTMQLPYDYNHNVMLTSFFIHPSKLNTWHQKIFHDFFEILISIIHYDYLFWMVFDYDMWHNQKLPHGILIEFWKQIYVCIQVGWYITINR